jgi:hypothetical protein
MRWFSVKDQLPPEGTIVDTKIHDSHGCRNESHLLYRGGMWWVRDGSMYIYYVPTHWRPLVD